MSFSRKIIITEPSNLASEFDLGSQMKIRNIFNVGPQVTVNTIKTNNNFSAAQNSELTKKLVSSIKDYSGSLPVIKDTYEFSTNFITQSVKEWNNYVSSSLFVFTNDHFTNLNGAYDTKDADYLGITQAVYSSNVNYQYNFLIEFYENQISQTFLSEKLIPNMYAIMFAKTERDVGSQKQTFNNIVTLNNRINATQTYSLQNKPLTNLNPQGEYHELYAREIRRLGNTINFAEDLNQITGSMTNIIVAPEQLKYVNQLSEFRELYPMYNEINITMDKFSSFSTLLKDANLTLSLINYVINNSSSTQNFFYSEQNVTYFSNINQNTIVDNATSIANQGIRAQTSTDLTTRDVSIYNILDWWEKTRNDFTPSETNNNNTLVLGIDDENIKLAEKDNEFARSLSYLIFYGKLRKMVEQTQRNFDQIVSGEPAYNEVVFYKIDKYKSNFVTPIQTFWVPNSTELDVFKFVDTQVKYNVEYEYRISAYTIVIGSSISSKLLSSQDILSSRSPVFPADISLSNLPVSNLNSLNTSNFVTTLEYTMTPLVTLVEVPIYSLRNKIVDDPPLTPEVLVIPSKNINNRIKFYFNNSTGEEEAEFNKIKVDDDQQFTNIKTMFATIPKKSFRFKSDDIASSFEVYRLSYKPTSYTDFRDSLLATVSTDYDQKTLVKASSASFIDNILPNRKYYYTFRTNDFHGHISNPTDVYEIEMVDDDGAIYLRTNIIKLENNSNLDTQTNKSFKKLFYIKPEILQTLINDETISNIKDTYDIYTFGNANILGRSQSPVWNKKFKLRFVSKKTGKMFDLNLQLNVEIDKENL
jgi:hypothetical protein